MILSMTIHSSERTFGWTGSQMIPHNSINSWRFRQPDVVFKRSRLHSNVVAQERSAFWRNQFTTLFYRAQPCHAISQCLERQHRGKQPTGEHAYKNTNATLIPTRCTPPHTSPEICLLLLFGTKLTAFTKSLGPRRRLVLVVYRRRSKANAKERMSFEGQSLVCSLTKPQCTSKIFCVFNHTLHFLSLQAGNNRGCHSKSWQLEAYAFRACGS